MLPFCLFVPNSNTALGQRNTYPYHGQSKILLKYLQTYIRVSNQMFFLHLLLARLPPLWHCALRWPWLVNQTHQPWTVIGQSNSPALDRDWSIKLSSLGPWLVNQTHQPRTVIGQSNSAALDCLHWWNYIYHIKHLSGHTQKSCCSTL